jgi:hypothetical protein
VAQLVTIVISALAGAIVITMTAPPAVAVITVCGIVLVILVFYFGISKRAFKRSTV